MTQEKKTYFGNKLIPEGEKKPLVNKVFDTVASRYDLMNDLMSLTAHRLWKRFAARKTKLLPGQSALDLAGGTADIAILLGDRVGAKGSVTVCDINPDMLELGRDKCIDSGHIGNMSFVQGDAEAIPFDDNTFHAVTIGFGIRNVTHLDKAIREMTRVTKPGGRVLCLEFSRPFSAILARLYDAYSFSIIPAIGGAVAGDRAPYVYLAESIRRFPPQEEFKEMLEDAGLKKVRFHNLTGGIAAVHVGVKL